MSRTLEEARAAQQTPISTGTVKPGDAYARIHAARSESLPLIRDFAHAWYMAPYTWDMTSWLGVPVMKNPMDLWMYHELFWNIRPRTVIETGTAMGGSSFFFATLQALMGIEKAQVITIDVSHEHLTRKAPGVTYVLGDCTDKAVVEDVLAHVTHPCFISLDSEHTEAHVLQELELYTPALTVGEFVVVEDTIVQWPDDDGALGAVNKFLAAHPGEWAQEEMCERYWLTMHSGGWLFKLPPERGNRA